MTIGLENGAWLAKKNLELGTGAALTLSAMGVPGAWPIVPALYIHQYNPQIFWDGALAWAELGRNVRDARDEISRLVEGIAESGWMSEDGRAFQQRMDRFLGDLLSIEIRAAMVSAVLFMAAALTMAMILFMALVAAVLVALAAWVVVATITPLSAALARIAALSALISLNTGLKSVEGMLNVALHTCAGIIGALIVGDVFVEATQGDFSGVQDFINGTIAQGPMLIWGSANRLERDATAFGLGGRFPKGGFYGRLAGSRAGEPLPPGLPQAAGAKGFNDIERNDGNQTITGGLTPDQKPDGSYDYPWDR